MSDNNSYSQELELGRRRRAGLTLGGFALIAVVVLVALVVWLLGRGLAPDQPTPAIPLAPGGVAPGAATPASGGWDVAAETALAAAPMVQFPESAVYPHPLTTDTAGPPLRLPTPTQTAGRVVPGGFPGTPEGAVAQLAELEKIGQLGGDPAGYAAAYDSIALPGAPAATSTGVYLSLQVIRGRAGFPATGMVPDLTFTVDPVAGLIKGTTDGGRYAVVCVLGQLTAGINGRSTSAGGADCQAMRYVNGDWRISPGAAAAAPSDAWPGTAEAVRAGYRAVS
ncbi:hypothetical protein [uncultured Pseudonocardia sp.]|uniref:hypothetical protein n=1 Tax=uncultured Pseudonocardia sp. TaxID=211455 RepID=UPI002628C49B|nr:hypothetical protein [uncultured Pseudonocardia sp.]